MAEETIHDRARREQHELTLALGKHNLSREGLRSLLKQMEDADITLEQSRTEIWARLLEDFTDQIETNCSLGVSNTSLLRSLAEQIIDAIRDNQTLLSFYNEHIIEQIKLKLPGNL